MQGTSWTQASLLADIYWIGTLACLVASTLLITLAMFADERQLAGHSVWLKPLKFHISTLVHIATLALVARLLDESTRASWLMYGLVGAVIIAALFELAYISLQAAGQQHSHFNETSSFHRLMYSLMGIMAVVLILVPAIMGWLVWRQAELAPVLRHAVALGLIFGFIATLVTAGYLGGNGSHFVGDHPTGAATVPFMGWSLATGDLRPAHFLALHIMQIVPLGGWLLYRWHADAPVWPIWLLQAAILALTLLLFVQALRGLPLTKWPFAG